MKIRIVCYEDPDRWILGKFARRLQEHLTALGVENSIGKTPDADADVNHHIAYVSYKDSDTGLNSLMVTHVDSVGKVRLLRRQLKTADLAICMSAQTAADLRGAMLPTDKICYVHPAHDGLIVPRRLRVGITTRLYEDGRKNEAAFEDMLDRIPKDDLHFVIMGAGWEAVVDRMRQRGFSVDLHSSFDLTRYQKLIPELDFFVYFGHDEGSMGFLDAIAAGVATIVTPQGYHLDVEGGITHHINDLEDLAATLTAIVEHRRLRADAVAGWSWQRYAEKHLELWQHLAGHALTTPAGTRSAVSGGSRDGLTSLETRPDRRLLDRVRFVSRILRTSIHRRLRTPTGSDADYE